MTALDPNDTDIPFLIFCAVLLAVVLVLAF